MKTQILHVHSGNLYGGVETLLVTLARYREFCPAIEHEFALCFEGRVAAELRGCGVLVYPLGRVRARNPLSIMRARKRLTELVRQRRYAAVVCHMPWPLALFGSAVRRTDAALIFWMHDAANGRHWVERCAQRVTPALVLCNSDYTASTLPRLYPQAPPHEVLYYPVMQPEIRLGADDRRNLRAEFDTPQDATVIVQASRMEAWKGHRLHLEALAHLRDMPEWICWIAGGPQRPAEEEYFNTLRADAARLGIAERIRFCGQRSDVARMLRAADIFCQPNTGPEPFGIVFIEALYAQLPVVTTAMGGPQEIVNDSCGVLVPPADPPALAAALRKLIVDPVERARLGAAGPARADNLCGVANQLRRLGKILSTYAGDAASPDVPNVARASRS